MMFFQNNYYCAAFRFEWSHKIEEVNIDYNIKQWIHFLVTIYGRAFKLVIRL